MHASRTWLIQIVVSPGEPSRLSLSRFFAVASGVSENLIENVCCDLGRCSTVEG